MLPTTLPDVLQSRGSVVFLLSGTTHRKKFIGSSPLLLLTLDSVADSVGLQVHTRLVYPGTTTTHQKQR